MDFYGLLDFANVLPEKTKPPQKRSVPKAQPPQKRSALTGEAAPKRSAPKGAAAPKQSLNESQSKTSPHVAPHLPDFHDPK